MVCFLRPRPSLGGTAVCAMSVDLSRTWLSPTTSFPSRSLSPFSLTLLASGHRRSHHLSFTEANVGRMEKVVMKIC